MAPGDQVSAPDAMTFADICFFMPSGKWRRLLGCGLCALPRSSRVSAHASRYVPAGCAERRHGFRLATSDSMLLSFPADQSCQAGSPGAEVLLHQQASVLGQPQCGESRCRLSCLARLKTDLTFILSWICLICGPISSFAAIFCVASQACENV